MCKSWCELILAVVAIVLGLMTFSAEVYKWTLVVLGVVLLVHSLTCKVCFNNKAMPTKAKRR